MFFSFPFNLFFFPTKLLSLYNNPNIAVKIGMAGCPLMHPLQYKAEFDTGFFFLILFQEICLHIIRLHQVN